MMIQTPHDLRRVLSICKAHVTPFTVFPLNPKLELYVALDLDSLNTSFITEETESQNCFNLPGNGPVEHVLRLTVPLSQLASTKICTIFSSWQFFIFAA